MHIDHLLMRKKKQNQSEFYSQKKSLSHGARLYTCVYEKSILISWRIPLPEPLDLLITECSSVQKHLSAPYLSLFNLFSLFPSVCARVFVCGCVSDL